MNPKRWKELFTFLIKLSFTGVLGVVALAERETIHQFSGVVILVSDVMLL
jgi:hypothetical protein